MKAAFLTLFVLLLCACSGNQPPKPVLKEDLKARAKIAEENLLKMRAAAIKFHAEKKDVPVMLDDLTGYGAGPGDLKADQYYSELGYTLFHLKFDDKGNLIEGKFRATPMAGADAYVVMLDAKSGEFQYGDKDAAAPAGNAPKEERGIEIK